MCSQRYMWYLYGFRINTGGYMSIHKIAVHDKLVLHIFMLLTVTSG